MHLRIYVGIGGAPLLSEVPIMAVSIEILINVKNMNIGRVADTIASELNLNVV